MWKQRRTTLLLPQRRPPPRLEDRLSTRCWAPSSQRVGTSPWKEHPHWRCWQRERPGSAMPRVIRHCHRTATGKLDKVLHTLLEGGQGTHRGTEAGHGEMIKVIQQRDTLPMARGVMKADLHHTEPIILPAADAATHIICQPSTLAFP